MLMKMDPAEGCYRAAVSSNKLQITMSEITNSPIELKKTLRSPRRRRLNLSEGHLIVCNLMSRNFYKYLIIKNFLPPIRIIPGKNNRIVEYRNNCQKLITSMSGSKQNSVF